MLMRWDIGKNYNITNLLNTKKLNGVSELYVRSITKVIVARYLISVLMGVETYSNGNLEQYERYYGAVTFTHRT